MKIMQMAIHACIYVNSFYYRKSRTMSNDKKLNPVNAKSVICVETLRTRFKPIYDDIFADLIARLDKK
jgi:hypothetical protein